MSDDLPVTRRFKALADEWTSEELGRFFRLAPEDMLQVRTCRSWETFDLQALKKRQGQLRPLRTHEKTAYVGG